jgi:hypothetical protein
MKNVVFGALVTMKNVAFNHEKRRLRVLAARSTMRNVALALA